MIDRLKKIFSVLPACGTFADVGCDHGYIAGAMLDSGKCKKAIVSDISAKCLEKAENLLAEYIAAGKASAVVSDGFEKLPPCDAALVAGMGGEEIKGILERAPELPAKLVLQPMKNCDRVRIAAVEKGYKIVTDSVFISGGKFYDLITLEKGRDALTDEEIIFGRTNIKERPEAFVKRVKQQIAKLNGYLSNGRMNAADSAKTAEKIERLKKYV